MTERERVLQETSAAREKVETLLGGLRRTKTAAEREIGVPVRSDEANGGAGMSSIDAAIASAQRMLDTLDRTLGQLRAGIGEDDLEPEAEVKRSASGE